MFSLLLYVSFNLITSKIAPHSASINPSFFFSFFFMLFFFFFFFFGKYSIRSIVCLNLPSFSGGLNPWGTPSGIMRRDVAPNTCSFPFSYPHPNIYVLILNNFMLVVSAYIDLIKYPDGI
jgi:hypothetical protein